MSNRICSVADCERKHYGHDLCHMHYMRAKRVRPLAGATCSAEGCERTLYAHGLCEPHNKRVSRLSQLTEPIRAYGADDTSYDAVHRRLRSQRGKASGFTCGCGAAADEWSYDHRAEVEFESDRGPYSPNLSHYIPRCISCHRRADRARSNIRKVS